MPESDESHIAVEQALREERGLVLTLGGYAVEFAGGVLVANERIPVPRFNFVQWVRVHRRRQAAFLERALDHFFQRAIRPSIRVERPVPGFLDDSLGRLGFRPAAEPWSLLLRDGPPPGPPAAPYEVRTARPEELPLVARFWTGDREREEFLRAISVALEHPNPDETLVPGVALRHGAPASAALLHTCGTTIGIHGVVTQPDVRGLGAATALVAGLLHATAAPGRARRTAMWSGSGRLESRLGNLGFSVAARYSVYELPPDARLELPATGPAGPPRWRPPRPSASPGG